MVAAEGHQREEIAKCSARCRLGDHTRAKRDSLGYPTDEILFQLKVLHEPADKTFEYGGLHQKFWAPTTLPTSYWTGQNLKESPKALQMSMLK